MRATADLLTLTAAVGAAVASSVRVAEGAREEARSADWVRPEWVVTEETPDTDWGKAINRAIDRALEGPRVVRLRCRRYVVRTPVNLAGRKGRNVAGLRLEGAARSTQYKRGTLLVGETGPGNCVVDTSDSDGVHLRDIGILRGEQNPSSIGLLQARGEHHGWAGDQFHENLFVDMGSDPAANGGLGTIGVVNVAGEETRWQNLQVWANLPLVLSWSRAIRRTRADLTGETPGVVLHTVWPDNPPVKSGSNTVFAVTGLGRLIAYDFVSPCVLINCAGTVDLGHTFLQMRASGSKTVNAGDYRYAIENWNCYQFRHFGAAEGCGGYLLNRRDFQNAEINLRLAATGETKRPVIQLYDDGGQYRFEGIDFKAHIFDKERALFGFRRYGAHSKPSPFRLQRNRFVVNLPEALARPADRALTDAMVDCEFHCPPDPPR